MKLKLFITVCLGLLVSLQSYSQFASTPCAAGPLPNACAPNTINLTNAFTNSGVINPSTENGVGCNSIGSNITAGQIGGSGGSQAYDGWFTTTVDPSGNVSIYAAGSDPVVGIYSGTCGSLTLVSCDDDGGTSLDALASATGLTPGATVWIRVWDYNGGTGTYTIAPSGGTPPVNDNCATPTNLTVNAAPIGGTDYCATVAATDWLDCEGNTEGNVWYTFTLSGTGQTTVNITNISCFGSGNGVDVTVMTGNCAAFTSVICQQAISSNSAINFAGVSGTTYYIMVDGDNAGGANSLCTFNIDVDLAAPVCGIVNYHAEQNFSPYNQINPFPSTMSCSDPWVYLAADDSVVSGNYISPSLYFLVNSGVDGNDQIWIYSGGTAALGSGTAIFANNIPNSTNYTVYGGWLSSTTNYYLEICGSSPGGVPWQVYDGGLGTVYGSGTANAAGCVRYGPFSPAGTATWTSNAPVGSINLTTTNGVTYFDPAVAGPGTYNITYSWNDGAGCSGSSTKTITVTAPYSFTSLNYNTVCKNTGNVSPTIVADAGGVYSSGTLGGALNTTTGVVNSNTAPAGTHTITYTLGTMPCGVQGIATITINPVNTVSAASSSPNVCVNTAITNITHTTTGATGIGAASGLPAGVTAGWSGNTITISGTPSAVGTFNYSIPLTGGCGTVNATGTITVRANNTVSAASASPNVCINTAITNISHTTTGATGIGAATGLPAGVTANWSGNTITISGTPTASGTFNYSIPLTGGCGTVNATGTITVRANNTVTPASSSPTLCINTAMTNITHTTTGATGIGAATGLPAGVTANWAGNTITISGTPTASGTFNYSIPLTGGCGTVNATGTITVNPRDNASFAYSGNTYCLTGANPTPISVSLPGGVFTISAPEVINASTGQINLVGSGLGTFTVTYNTAVLGNPCPNTATTNITITAAPSAAFSYDLATYCQNAAAPVITFESGASAGVFSSTPAGLSLNTSSGAVTLSTSTPGTYTVTNSIAASGGCAAASANTSITVNPNATINLTSAGATTNQTLCINTAITNITYAVAGGGTGAGVVGLPAGVTGSFGAGVFTISGTPTASGTFNYTVTTTGTCGQATANGTITVTPANTVSAASSSPTLCINTSMTNITHTTTGATGIGAATGLPAGVTANWAGNTITISGTPTASGTFNYSIPLTGGCGTVNATGTITVTPDNTVSAASSSPTLCINTVMTNITHTTTGATGIGAATGLPAGVTANWSGNTITISGTPTASGTFNYTIPLTGGCGAVNATGTITVTPDNTVSSASSSPTLCINTSMTNITHTTTGATGIGAATGLPAGVTANWAGNTITISGTPTASGTFNYTIPLTGGCGTDAATGTITVTPNNTVTPASSSPTLCINTSMTNITHTTTGATGIGAATGLPAGVTANWSGNSITISGIPTASGTFNYTIPLTGGCGTVNATGTITVTPDNTVSAASSSPTLCINTSMTNITHTTTGATGIGAATGLPAGVTANWSGNSITISGIPTASGTFNYTIPLTGGCGTVNATGTITVTPDNTVSAASSSPTLCINTSMTNITHTTTGATGIGAATGLPAGVTANWSGNTITISGTPTASGTFNYTIPLTGGCGVVNATGTITVTPNNTVSAASSSPTLCINTSMTNITHTTTGATGIGAATGLPAGVTANWSGNTITISGTPTASGTFNYTIPLTGGCGVVNATGTIVVTPLPIIGITTASECENVPGSGQALNIDVTGLNGAINPGTITWYTDNTYLTSFVPNNETVNNGQVFYFEVLQNGCTVRGTITYSVSGNILINDPMPELCEDVLGGGSTANIDLTTYNNSVFAGATSYTWTPNNGTQTNTTINNGDSVNVQVQQGSCPVVNIFVHFTVNELPTAVISGSDTICAGDPIPDLTLTLTGNGPWSVTYTDGTTPVNVNIASSPFTLSGLADGTYTITAVSDANCTGSGSGSATILTNPIPTFTATLGLDPSTCGGTDGTIVLNGLTATTSYDITYNDGTGTVTLNGQMTDGSGNITISGLSAGSYSAFTATLAGCTGNVAGPITLTDPNAPTFTATLGLDPSTCGGTDGTIVLNGLTATTSYDITYNDGTGTVTLNGQMTDGSGNITISGLSAGSYSAFTATLAGCTGNVAGPITLTDPNAPTFTATLGLDPSTCGGTDGTIVLSGLTATTSYDITYNDGTSTVTLNGQMTDGSGNITISGLSAGSYSAFTATLAGCTGNVAGPITLTDPNAPTFTAVLGLDPSTCGGTDGTIVLSGLTATTSYDITYNDGTSTVTLNGQMTDGSGNITISGLSAGSYSAFTATLAGCTGNVAGPITLTDPNAPNPTVQFTQHPSCGNADGIITTSNLNPLTAYTIGYFDGSSVVNLGSLVSDASGNIIISGLTAGSYSNFTVLSGSGCLGTDNTTINLVDQNSVVASFIASPDNGTIPLSVSFTNTSVGATSYLWNFGNGSTSILTNPTAVYNDMGMFTATLIAMTGNCSDTFTVIIETFGKSSILIPNVFTPNNDGSNDVFTVEGTNLESVEGEIFNRWGQKMFEWKHVKGYWDGKTQSGTDSPDGTYFYIIKAKGLDGEEYFKKGGFSLIR